MNTYKPVKSSEAPHQTARQLSGNAAVTKRAVEWFVI